MSTQKISKLQIVDQKYWSGLTRSEHLGWLGMLQPELINNTVEQLYEVNYGADNVVNFINKLPERTVSGDGPYQWLVQGTDELVIPLVKATSTDSSYTAATATTKFGQYGSTFILWFAERYFSGASAVLSGNYPESYQYRVSGEPISAGSLWGYPVQIVTGDPTVYAPYEDLIAGTLFSEMYGLVEPTLSIRGTEVKHSAPFRMENIISHIRKNYEVPGNMIDKGGVEPLSFAFVGPDGKVYTRWLDKLGWDYRVQFMRDRARLCLLGKSTKLSDGSYNLKGESGNSVVAGFGLYEQMEGSNVMFYNDFNLDALTDFAMQIAVGKLPEDKLEFILSTGQYGAYQFHKAASNKLSSYPWVLSSHNVQTQGDKVVLNEGQMIEYKSVNGIVFKIMIDPMKDDRTTHKLLHSKGGLLASYTYDIFDIGTTKGKPNITRIAPKSGAEFFGYTEGLRSPFSPSGKIDSPKNMNSSIDGYACYGMWRGGVQLTNPLKTGRFLPIGYK